MPKEYFPQKEMAALKACTHNRYIQRLKKESKFE